MIERCAECGGVGTFRATRENETRFLCGRCVREVDSRLVPLIEALDRPKVTRTLCLHCGWSVEQIEQTGLVGCPLCYVSLRAAIWRALGIEGKSAKVS